MFDPQRASTPNLISRRSLFFDSRKCPLIQSTSASPEPQHPYVVKQAAANSRFRDEHRLIKYALASVRKTRNSRTPDRYFSTDKIGLITKDDNSVRLGKIKFKKLTQLGYLQPKAALSFFQNITKDYQKEDWENQRDESPSKSPKVQFTFPHTTQSQSALKLNPLSARIEPWIPHQPSIAKQTNNRSNRQLKYRIDQESSSIFMTKSTSKRSIRSKKLFARRRPSRRSVNRTDIR